MYISVDFGVKWSGFISYSGSVYCFRGVEAPKCSTLGAGYATASPPLSPTQLSWSSSPHMETKPDMNPRNFSTLLRGHIRPRSGPNWQRYWICKTCRTNSLPRLSFSSSQRPLDKPYYVTTPIFYVNAGNL
jgi:hypothetical protein